MDIRYPDGIKLLTASFADHFGAWEGEKLRVRYLANYDIKIQQSM